MDDVINASQSGTMTDEMENMYLNFYVGSGVYGVEIRYVLQIVGMQGINPMPEMPPHMKGFINLRGNVIPVVSMRERFGKYEETFTERTCIVIVSVGDREIGLIVSFMASTIKPISRSPTFTERTCIVIVSVGDREIGLIVDAIKETITIEPDRISPQPTTTQNADNAYIIGIAQLGSGSVSILIDVQKLFDNFSF